MKEVSLDEGCRYPLLRFLKNISRFHRAPHTSKARFPEGGSPYQPVLMLAVLLLLERHHRSAKTVKEFVTYDECKAEFRLLYSRIFTPLDEKAIAPMITQPFWVFGSGRSIEPIWRLVPKAGQEQAIAHELSRRKDPVKEESTIHRLVLRAEFVPGVAELLGDAIARDVVHRFVLAKSFPSVEDIVSDILKG